MSEHLIITGATGWLGSNLMAKVEEVAPGRRVSVLVLPGEGDGIAARYPRLDIQTTEGDVGDPSAAEALFASCTGGVVIHAAGVIHPKRVSDFQRVNVQGTRSITAAAARSGVSRFVHISSNSPFGLNSGPSDAFRANEPYNPYLGYGRSKMEAELAVRGAGATAGFDVVILRPPWFYGPGQPERQARFLSMVRQGSFPVPGDGTQRRSMVFVPDLASAALAATEDSARPGAYWIADPTPYSLREIVATTQAALVAEGIPVKPGYRRIPGAISALARRTDSLIQARGRYSAQVHVLGELGTTIACEVGPAQEALGWTPGAGLLEGMRASIRDWLARGHTID
jgi:nucleoside-diphosphate-sugar epimerase